MYKSFIILERTASLFLRMDKPGYLDRIWIEWKTALLFRMDSTLAPASQFTSQITHDALRPINFIHHQLMLRLDKSLLNLTT